MSPAPVRLALLGPWPASSGALGGGVEAVVHTIASGLASLKGTDVHVVTWSSRAGVSREGALTVHEVPSQRALRNLTLGAPDRRRMGEVVRELEPGLVHAHGLTDYGLVAVAAARPSVVTVHGIPADETPHVRGALDRFRWWTLERRAAWCLARARWLTVPTAYARSRLTPRDDASVETIENPVDATYFDLPRATGAPPTILCISRLIPLKRVEDVLAAFAEIRRAVPKARLEVAGGEGEPGFASHLQTVADGLGVAAHTTFHGFVRPVDLPALVARASVLVHASAQENAPIAVEQALAAGVPIVATNVGGLPSVVRDGETGFLVEPGAPERLAERAIALLTDAALHSALSLAARRDAEARFHPRAVREKTLRLYDRVLGRPFLP